MSEALRTALVMAVVSLVAGCSSKPGSKPAELFPPTNAVPGWARAAEARTFEAGRLWEYVDGDAERYIQAGAVSTLTVDYRYRDKIEAVADIHIMKAPDGARKVLAAESSADSRPLPLGEEARLFPNSLVFRKGPYLVRLTAFHDAPELGKALEELGRAIEERLGR